MIKLIITYIHAYKFLQRDIFNPMTDGSDGGGYASQSIEDSPKYGDSLESVLAAAVGH